MLHIAAKIFWFLCQPSSIAVIAIAAGVWRMRRSSARAGLGLAVGGLAFLLCAGLLPLGQLLILPLEERFAHAVQPAVGRIVAGIIILGGGEDGRVSAGRGGLALTKAGERITEGLRLALRFPQAKLVFTGGVGSLWPGQQDATGPVADFLSEAGVARSRILLEGRSRNTYENAAFTRELVTPKPGEHWLLVTSAYHMPRAMGAFRKAGFLVIPVPVDFRTRDGTDAIRPFESIPDGLERVDTAAKEWIGLAAYWLTGRSDAVFPGPRGISASE